MGLELLAPQLVILPQQLKVGVNGPLATGATALFLRPLGNTMNK
jgi:hypothetical protein